MILHGETSLEIHAPLPVEGELLGVSSFGPIFDKGAEMSSSSTMAWRSMHE
jgi:hypothetical protein